MTSHDVLFYYCEYNNIDGSDCCSNRREGLLPSYDATFV